MNTFQIVFISVTLIFLDFNFQRLPCDNVVQLYHAFPEKVFKDLRSLHI